MPQESADPPRAVPPPSGPETTAPEPRKGGAGTRRRRTSTLATLAALAVLGVGIGSFFAVISNSLHETATENAPGLVALYNQNYDQFTCYRTIIEKEIPKGAPTYIEWGSTNYQTLNEAAQGWSDITSTRAQGQYVVTLTPSSHGRCNGVGVEVTH